MAIHLKSWYCVLLQRRRHAMYHYMAALHQRFFQVPDFTELEEEIEGAIILGQFTNPSNPKAH